ncbi:MAG TPA: guanylate kinase [Luteibaculaceae bacterium]|nr:guanylate kinase [Luteibaculaceae bacterium]
MKGKAIIFSAPSGAGKTTIVKHLLKVNAQLAFSISATSRPCRFNETPDKDYYFLSNEAFDQRIQDGDFIEWEEVYSGTKYGTLKSEIERIWASGKHVIFDVDVSGGLNLKRYFGDRALSIFVVPPSVQALRERLIGRGTENDESLMKRVAKAESEIMRAREFEVLITNDVLEQALRDAEHIVNAFLNDRA